MPITPPPWDGGIFRSRPDNIRVDVSPTRGSNFWGPRDSVLEIRHEEIQLFLFKGLPGIMEGGEIRTRGLKPMFCRRRHM